jgi:ribosomal protein L37AE/L43A
MSITGMVAAIRAAMHKPVVCKKCGHKQEALRKHATAKCKRCGAVIHLQEK